MTLLLQGAGVQAISAGGSDPIGDALRADAAAYWTLDTSGTDSASSNDLTPINSPSFVSGKINGAIDISATAYLTTTSPVTDVLTNAFTITLWIKPTGTGTLSEVLTHSDVDDIVIEVLGDIDGNPYIEAGVYRVEFGRSFKDSQLLSLNEWHFIVLSWEAGVSTQLLADNVPGTIYGEEAIVTNKNVPVGNFSLGMNYNNLSYILDEFSIIDRVLTPDEIAYLWNGGAGRALFPAP